MKKCIVILRIIFEWSMVKGKKETPRKVTWYNRLLEAEKNIKIKKYYRRDLGF